MKRRLLTEGDILKVLNVDEPITKGGYVGTLVIFQKYANFSDTLGNKGRGIHVLTDDGTTLVMFEGRFEFVSPKELVYDPNQQGDKDDDI